MLIIVYLMRKVNVFIVASFSWQIAQLGSTCWLGLTLTIPMLLLRLLLSLLWRPWLGWMVRQASVCWIATSSQFWYFVGTFLTRQSSAGHLWIMTTIQMMMLTSRWHRCFSGRLWIDGNVSSNRSVKVRFQICPCTTNVHLLTWLQQSELQTANNEWSSMYLNNTIFLSESLSVCTVVYCNYSNLFHILCYHVLHA